MEGTKRGDPRIWGGAQVTVKSHSAYSTDIFVHTYVQYGLMSVQVDKLSHDFLSKIFSIILCILPLYEPCFSIQKHSTFLYQQELPY